MKTAVNVYFLFYLNLSHILYTTCFFFQVPWVFFLNIPKRDLSINAQKFYSLRTLFITTTVQSKFLKDQLLEFQSINRPFGWPFKGEWESLARLDAPRKSIQLSKVETLYCAPVNVCVCNARVQANDSVPHECRWLALHFIFSIRIVRTR